MNYLQSKCDVSVGYFIAVVLAMAALVELVRLVFC